jgi:hypothetical protein
VLVVRRWLLRFLVLFVERWFCTLVECWLNDNKDQYETAGGTMIVHESRTAGEPGTRSIERPILSLNPRNRVPG